MSEFLKGNFKVKKQPVDTRKDEEKTGAEKIADELRKRALNSLGGSMVYVDRSTLVWDGKDDDQSNN